jgi:O-antigen/teichoic acid export membrane protein
LAKGQTPHPILANIRGVVGHLVQRAPRMASFADQGFQGVANIVASALVARSLPHADFAVIGLMIGAHYFAWGIHRSMVILPYILDASEGSSRREISDAWWWIGALVSLALGVALFVGALLFKVLGGDNAWIWQSLAYAAVASPASCLLEFARRRLYQEERAIAAAACSALYGAGLVAIAGLVLLTKSGLTTAALAWPLAAMLGVGLGAIIARPRGVAPRELVRVWRHHLRFATGLALTSIPYAIYTTAVVILVGIFGGPTAAAAFTAGRTLTNPAMAAVSAVDTLDKPRAAKALASDGMTGLRASIARTRRTVLLLTGPYLGVLALFSPWILSLAFGPAYAAHGLGVSLLAISFFFTGLNQPSETALIVLRATRSMLAIRSTIAVLTVLGLWLLGGRFGFLGCAAAIATTNLLNVVALSYAERRANA